MNDVKFQSNLTIIQDLTDKNFNAAKDQLKEESIEWVQYQMLYGYKDRHGKDGHTEIYDTGYLSEKSLKSEAKKSSQNIYDVTVGSDADYAVFVHAGTRKLKARPFITDALNNNQKNIRRIVENNVKQGF